LLDVRRLARLIDHAGLARSATNESYFLLVVIKDQTSHHFLDLGNGLVIGFAVSHS
jgi:hypothetical protein